VWLLPNAKALCARCGTTQARLTAAFTFAMVQVEEARLRSVQAGAERALKVRQAGALSEHSTAAATRDLERGVHLRHTARLQAAKREFVRAFDTKTAAAVARNAQV
jgi:hypothetical protein